MSVLRRSFSYDLERAVSQAGPVVAYEGELQILEPRISIVLHKYLSLWTSASTTEWNFAGAPRAHMLTAVVYILQKVVSKIMDIVKKRAVLKKALSLRKLFESQECSGQAGASVCISLEEAVQKLSEYMQSPQMVTKDQEQLSAAVQRLCSLEVPLPKEDSEEVQPANEENKMLTDLQYTVEFIIIQTMIHQLRHDGRYEIYQQPECNHSPHLSSLIMRELWEQGGSISSVLKRLISQKLEEGLNDYRETLGEHFLEQGIVSVTWLPAEEQDFLALCLYVEAVQVSKMADMCMTLH
jgi:hypothetical protein